MHADEDRFIQAIAAAPNDEATRLVYADWLEERNDPRGPFLRQFLAAAQAKKPLPDGSAFPKPWRDLCGVTLLEAIPRFHLEGVPPGRLVSVFMVAPGTGERLGLLASGTVGEGSWVDLAVPIRVRAGEAFIAVPDS